jgi:hypothetical protein
MDTFVAVVAGQYQAHFRGQNVYDEYGHTINGSKCAQSDPTRRDISPTKPIGSLVIAGVSTLYVVWIPMTMVKPGQSISITFKPHLVKPNWQAVDSFRLQDGGWIIQKCSTY